MFKFKSFRGGRVEEVRLSKKARIRADIEAAARQLEANDEGANRPAEDLPRFYL